MGFTEFEQRDFKVVGIGGTLREGSASLGALKRALAAAGEAGAETELLDLRELGLPMYEPGLALEGYGPGVGRLVGAMRDADALIPSIGAYHGGTPAGATKNALDFARFLSGGERPYFDGRVVGLVSTGGGEQAATNANGAVADVVYARRGVVAPPMLALLRSWRVADGGNVADDGSGDRLDRLGRLAVEPAGAAA